MRMFAFPAHGRDRLCAVQSLIYMYILAPPSHSAGAPLGSAMGTIFGGLPTGLSAIKWRGIFAVLAGLGALAFLCTIWTAPKNPKAKVPGGPDWTGAGIITAGLTLVLFCMSQGTHLYLIPYFFCSYFAGTEGNKVADNCFFGCLCVK